MSSIDYEKVTIEKMVQLYCRNKHKDKSEKLCPDCQEVLIYAQDRLDKCPFGDDKGACSECSIHCYKKEMKEKVKVIMRFSGPRMLLYHPFDFLIHYTKDKLIKQKRRR
ncbi:MAG TPA: nitrous oxide-stimulated promoter family protein [Bacteroidales bacterium]|nr:nitrous oxide-stimulated promoter family protein [Bacteroidales bacterium]